MLASAAVTSQEGKETHSFPSGSQGTESREGHSPSQDSTCERGALPLAGQEVSAGDKGAVRQHCSSCAALPPTEGCNGADTRSEPAESCFQSKQPPQDISQTCPCSLSSHLTQSSPSIRPENHLCASAAAGAQQSAPKATGRAQLGKLSLGWDFSAPLFLSKKENQCFYFSSS